MPLDQEPPEGGVSLGRLVNDQSADGLDALEQDIDEPAAVVQAVGVAEPAQPARPVDGQGHPEHRRMLVMAIGTNR